MVIFMQKIKINILATLFIGVQQCLFSIIQFYFQISSYAQTVLRLHAFDDFLHISRLATGIVTSTRSMIFFV